MKTVTIKMYSIVYCGDKDKYNLMACVFILIK